MTSHTFKTASLSCFVATAVAIAGCGGGGSDSNNVSTSTSGIGTIEMIASTPLPPTVNPLIGTTTTGSLSSRHTGVTYTYHVYAPPSASSGTTPLPIVYSADAQYLFDDIVAILQTLKIDAYVVSVDYIDASERASDYLLPGAQAYFQFFTDELLPVVEGEHSVDPSRRTLVGYSFSGVFALVGLFFDDPNHHTFSSIISIDGSFSTDPIDIDALVQNEATSLPVSLYMSCAGLAGNCSSVMPLFGLIANRGFHDVVHAELDDYFNADHGTVVGPTLMTALAGLFTASQ